MDNKSVNQDQNTSKSEPKKSESIGDKLKNLGDKFFDRKTREEGRH